MLERKKIPLIFALITLVLAANALVSYRATQTLIENERLETRSHSVLIALGQILSAMKDAETGQRGFIITGVDAFLEPYETAKPRLEREIRKFDELTRNQPNHQRRLGEIKRLATGRLALVEETNELVRAGQRDAARAIVISGRGKQLMDDLRRVVGEAEAEEGASLAHRIKQSEEGGRRAIITFAVVNLAAFALVALAFYLNHRELEARAQSEAILQEAKTDLERRVRERTLQLSEANIELERSNRELQDFAFVASHDLQEPLRKIQAFGDLLMKDHGAALGPEGRDFLARMRNASQRMHALINDLLTFSRVTTKGQPFTPVDLATVAREVVNDLEGRVRQTGGRVEIGPLPTIEADPLQMRQLLQNLLGNALKFHRPDEPPVVRLDSAVDDGFCQLRVTDNGIGFDEKYLDRIFTPFQRLHGRNEYEGTGMGLAISRKIVERHGGEITAQSQPGAGSTFLITLPSTHSTNTRSEESSNS